MARFSPTIFEERDERELTVSPVFDEESETFTTRPAWRVGSEVTDLHSTPVDTSSHLTAAERVEENNYSSTPAAVPPSDAGYDVPVIAPLIRKKRGRPPKATKPAATAPESAKTAATAPESAIPPTALSAAAATAIANPPKKKRGRPPKTAQPTAVSTAAEKKRERKSTAPPVSSTAAPRKSYGLRDRPRQTDRLRYT